MSIRRRGRVSAGVSTKALLSLFVLLFLLALRGADGVKRKRQEKQEWPIDRLKPIPTRPVPGRIRESDSSEHSYRDTTLKVSCPFRLVPSRHLFTPLVLKQASLDPSGGPPLENAPALAVPLRDESCRCPAACCCGKQNPRTQVRSLA